MAVEPGDQLKTFVLAELQYSLADYVGHQTQDPANGSHTGIVPLEVSPESQEYVPAGMPLRDALFGPEDKTKAVRPAAQLLGKMVRFG